MMSFFSSFDLIIFYWSYLSMILVSMYYFLNIYKINSISQFNNKFCQNVMIKFFYSLKPKDFSKFSSLLTMTIMILILTMNFFSVFPFIFPLGSQFGTVLSLGFSFWLGLISFTLFNNLKGFLLHFIPEGTPLMLTAFLFLIEIVSNFIRPITLTVRLVANILAGHLLMILLSKLVFITNFMFLGYLILNVVELLVGLIQSYIFSTMVVLYFSEVH